MVGTNGDGQICKIANQIIVVLNIEVCKRRDPKGLYAKALSGEIPNFTGISSPYEEPENPELIVETHLDSTEDIITQIVAKLKEDGILPADLDV